MALRHMAARLAQGCTISHALSKFSKLQNAWVIVNEHSEVPLSMLGEISRWGLVGCKVILVEDRIGQFLPIFDTWRVDVKKLSEGTLMRQMCNFLHVELDIYKRGLDQSLFDFYHSFYSTNVDDPFLVPANVRAAIQRYPW